MEIEASLWLELGTHTSWDFYFIFSLFHFYFLLMSPFLYLSFCGFGNIWAARCGFLSSQNRNVKQLKKQFHPFICRTEFFSPLLRNKEKDPTDSVVDS